MEEKRKKFLLVLPVLVLPFIIFFCWVLGLVGPETANGQTGGGGGLNLTLPTAVLAKDSGWSKMQFYAQADQDSIRRRQLEKKDPYYRRGVDSILHRSVSHASYAPYPPSALQQADEEERKANQQIAAIHKAISAHPVVSQKLPAPSAALQSPEVDRLESMMHQMKEKQEPDSDLIQMNQLMQKIMEVQHPEMVQQKLQDREKERPVYAVETSEPDVNESMRIETNRFYSLDNHAAEELGNTISAVVQDDQVITDGAVLKLRLTQSIFIDGKEISENQFVYGVAKLAGNRMTVLVKGIQINNEVWPVHLSVFANDGMEGLPLQGAGAKEILNNSVDQSMQGITASTMGIGLGAEMAGAAVQAGKSLLKKHLRPMTITVPAGFLVLLKNME